MSVFFRTSCDIDVVVDSSQLPLLNVLHFKNLEMFKECKYILGN